MVKIPPTPDQAAAFEAAVEDRANKAGGNYTMATFLVKSEFGLRFPDVDFSLEPLPTNTSGQPGPEATTN